MIHQFWRLTEGGEANLGLAVTADALVLGRTPLIERRNNNFVVRNRSEIERLLSHAFRREVVVDRLMPGLAVVASALNANDPCLARIAAVHLRIPDLPSHNARNDLETQDALIKSDWNPALHPRTGTPPNPGWFAPTDDESSSTPITDDDASISLSDASQSIGENRVVLPPGPRNDELGDFLQWIANAKPADESAIRAEIDRYHYDIGDTSGGDALNAALNNVLGPGVEYKDRQQILNGLGPYSQSDSASDPSTDLLIGAGLLLLGMIPPAAAAETASAAWQLGWAARGLYFSEQLGANLPATFETIDSFANGLATSIKSIDLNAATYQNAARLTYRLNAYVDAMALYDGSALGVTEIEASDIGRALSLAIPKGSMTVAQRAAIEAARVRAQAFGVDLIITEF
jgi:hypothetical protein